MRHSRSRFSQLPGRSLPGNLHFGDVEELARDIERKLEKQSPGLESFLEWAGFRALDEPARRKDAPDGVGEFGSGGAVRSEDVDEGDARGHGASMYQVAPRPAIKPAAIWGRMAA
jgi:hypothetical protein